MNTTYKAAPWTGNTTVDFDTRLEIAAIGIDVRLSQVLDTVADADAAEEARRAVEEAEELLSVRGGQIEPNPSFQPNPLLKAAGDVIRVRGWLQGDLQAEDGTAVCALGAIYIACDALGQRSVEAERILLERITDEFGPNTIPGWNDRADQTEEGVLRLMY